MPVTKGLPAHLTAPRPSRYLVANPSLPAWLEDCAGASLVMAIAPAGFGKTTALLALHDAMHEAGQRTAWVQLASGDDHIERFCAYLRQACDLPAGGATGGAGGTLVDAAAAGSAISIGLLDAVAALEQPTAIFLDDFHHIADEHILDTVQRMIDRLPSGSRLFIASRAMPGLKLSRWKAQGRLLQIGIPELAFDFDQAKAFLNQRHHLGLDDRGIGQLLAETEGWPTGLQLAALALSERADKRGFVENLGQRSADIAAYLYEEVFADQPREIRDFLLQTSIASQLSASLCEALTRQRGAAPLLRRLEQLNLFVVRVGDSGTDYRCHPLFAEFLRRKLREDQPELEVTLHGRAARWHQAHAEAPEAIAHALAAGNHALACELLEGHVWQALAIGHVSTCAHWLGALPQAVLDEHCSLALALAWVSIFQRDYARAGAIAKRLKEHPGARAIDEFRVLEPMSLGLMDRGAECEALLAAQLEGVNLSGISAATLHNVRAYAYVCAQRFGASIQEAELAIEQFHALGSSYGHAYSVGMIAIALQAQGRARQAKQSLELAFAEAVAATGRSHTCSAHVAVFLAEALYETGETDRAAALIEEYLDHTRMTGQADMLITSHRILARARCREGRHADAQPLISACADLGRSLGLRRVVAAMRLEAQYLQMHRHDHGFPGGSLDAPIHDPVWDACAGRLAPGNDAETFEVAAQRHKLRTRNAQAVIETAPALIARAAGSQRRRLEFKLRLLFAQALDSDGQREAAAAQAAELVAMLIETELVSSVVDEGPSACALVLDAAQASGAASDVLERLRAAVAGATDSHAPAGAPAAPQPLGPLVDVDRLSEREMQVLRCVAAGMPNKRIATSLCISEQTVKFHLRNVNAKLSAKNRTHAVFVARQLGWDL